MAAKIKKIVIEVNNKRIELTKKEAVELKSILEDMFGGKVVIEKHYDRPWIWPNWNYTHWIYNEPTRSVPGTTWGKATNTSSDTLYLSATAGR